MLSNKISSNSTLIPFNFDMAGKQFSLIREDQDV